MARYCLEFGSEVPASVVVHALKCECFDLSTLLGDGKIAHLGEFDAPLQALDAARRQHPQALPCVTCLRAAQQPPARQRELPVSVEPWSVPLLVPERQKPKSVRPH
jgi:hypothetical protein